MQLVATGSTGDRRATNLSDAGTGFEETPVGASCRSYKVLPGLVTQSSSFWRCTRVSGMRLTLFLQKRHAIGQHALAALWGGAAPRTHLMINVAKPSASGMLRRSGKEHGSEGLEPRTSR